MVASERSISGHIEKRLRKYWATLKESRNYLIPESREDFASLESFPYFQVGNLCIYVRRNDLSSTRTEKADIANKSAKQTLVSNSFTCRAAKEETR